METYLIVYSQSYVGFTMWETEGVTSACPHTAPPPYTHTQDRDGER